MHARVSRLIREVSRIYREEANLNGLRNCRGFIGQKESFSMDREAVEKLSRQNPEISMDRVCDKICHDKKKKGLKTTIKKKKKSHSILGLAVVGQWPPLSLVGLVINRQN